MLSLFNPIKVLSLFIICLPFQLFSSSPSDFTADEQTSEDIKSVRFRQEGSLPGYPFIQPGEELTLSFDLLDGSGASLWYSITHCDRDWNVSDLFVSDYIDGYSENQITDYMPSFNTRVSYTHYRLTLPNSDIRFLISGNYLITVWAASDPDHTLLTRRFYISENSSSTSVHFVRPMKPGTTETHQQAEITLNMGNHRIIDPFRQVTITIMQNGRPDRMKSGLSPDFVGGNKLEYNTLSDKTLMAGGNEFRYFDIKTIRQTRQNVRSVDFVDGLYHVLLLPSDDREHKPYFYNEDLNGRYLVAMEEGREPDYEADYVWVFFTLPAYSELRGGDLYIAGDFNGWQYNVSNRMVWNVQRGRYEGSLLLKQGWYNYEYLFVPDRKGEPERYPFEGSHWETENDYLILTYFRDPSARYDRLTGVALANSSNR